MPKQAQALAEMPSAVRTMLRDLGANLAIARKRRKQSMRAWAARIGVSEPTLKRLEQGRRHLSQGLRLLWHDKDVISLALIHISLLF